MEDSGPSYEVLLVYVDSCCHTQGQKHAHWVYRDHVGELERSPPLLSRRSASVCITYFVWLLELRDVPLRNLKTLVEDMYVRAAVIRLPDTCECDLVAMLPVGTLDAFHTAVMEAALE